MAVPALNAKLPRDRLPRRARCAKAGNLRGVHSNWRPAERLPFGAGIPKAGPDASTIRLRSNSATAPKTVKTIFPADVDVSISSEWETKSIHKALKVSAVETGHFINEGRTIKVEQQVEKDNPRVVKYLKTAAAKRAKTARGKHQELL